MDVCVLEIVQYEWKRAAVLIKFSLFESRKESWHQCELTHKYHSSVIK